MYLTGLAVALRGTGLEVEEIPGWETRGRGPMIRARSVICHHTGTAPTRDDPFPTRRTLIVGRSDLPGPLCNLALDGNGRVWIVAAGRANHAGVVRRLRWSNPYAIGIEAEGDGRSAWPRRQYEAYALLCKALIEHYGISPADVRGHKEVCFPSGRKIDPNFDMSRFRDLTEDIEVIRDEDLDRIADRVWNRDFIKAPSREPDAATNPTWRAASFLRMTVDDLKRLMDDHPEPPPVV